MKLVFLLAFFLIIGLLPAAASSSEYRCEGKVISVGDTSGELIMKCGEPDWKQSHTEEIIETLDKGNKQKILIAVEEWTYNLGPQRFMRIFKLKDGTVVDMWLGDYGYTKEATGSFQCSEQSVSVGDSAVEVMAKCGEPLWKGAREEIIREQLDKNTVRNIQTTIEYWTYNFGPNKFLRIITFRNGKVTNIEAGGYGYEEKPKEEKH